MKTYIRRKKCQEKNIKTLQELREKYIKLSNDYSEININETKYK